MSFRNYRKEFGRGSLSSHLGDIWLQHGLIHSAYCPTPCEPRGHSSQWPSLDPVPTRLWNLVSICGGSLSSLGFWGIKMNNPKGMWPYVWCLERGSWLYWKGMREGSSSWLCVIKPYCRSRITHWSSYYLRLG